MQIVKDGTAVSPLEVMCKDLSAWDRPPAKTVAVDVVRGRITFPAGEEPKQDLIVSYNYGFSADIGGGPYDRRERMAATSDPFVEFRVGKDSQYEFKTLADALNDPTNGWVKAGRPPAVIRIYDSLTYDANLSIALPKNGALVIDCENEERPTLINAGPLTVTSEATSTAETPAFSRGGLVIEGSLATSGRVNLTVNDCTLGPGQALDEDGYPVHPDGASLKVSGTGKELSDTTVAIQRSILGPLEVPVDCQGLTVRDSLVDAPIAKGADQPSRYALAADAAGTGPGPVTDLERVTVFGQVHVRELSLASEVIFVQPAAADRRQEGCVRFSSIPDGSQTPRHFRCQPDLAIEARKKELSPVPLSGTEQTQIEMRLRPQFTDLRYGQPAFAQLANACADGIKTGAEDGSEMGAFSLLQQPQRLANLQIALGEYLRFGLEAGIFFVT